MRRREFLSLVGAGAAAAAVGARAGGGQSRPARRLILVFVTGGWDTTYALDPKEPAHVDVPDGAVQQFGALDIFIDPSRPGVTRFFERHADVATVVRGISTDAINHNECQRRIATGTREETSPDFGAIVAHDLGNSLPLPYLILGDTAFTGPYAVSSARVGGRNQLVTLLGGADGRPTDFAADAGDPPVPTDQLLDRYAQASAARARATRGAMGYNRRRIDDFLEARGHAAQLRALRDRLGPPGETQSFSAQLRLAVDALAHDLSQAVMVSTDCFWDTHSNNAAQSGFHDLTFAGLADLVDDLALRPGRAAGTTMLDDTVVVAFSELARSQRLNGGGGKDHWPVTSALVVNGGLRSRVIGATTADCASVPIDLATGGPGATQLMYSHFVAGVLALCGVDPADHLGTPRLDALG